MARCTVLMAFALAALGAAPAPARAASKSVVLVVHPVVNVSDAESRAIANELAASMHRRFEAKVFVADRSKLPANIAEDCVSDMGCTGEIADRQSADQVVYLVMVKIGSKIQVDATWVDPQTGRATPRDTFELEANGSDRSRVVGEVAPTMIPRGAVPLAGSSSQKPPAKAEVSTAPPSTRSSAASSSDSRITSSAETGGATIGAWVLSGAAFLSLAGGIAVVLSGIGEYDTLLEGTCLGAGPIPARCAGDLDRFGTRSTVGAALIIGAALAGGAAVGLFVAGEEPVTAAIPMPSVSADGFGLAWGGSF